MNTSDLFRNVFSHFYIKQHIFWRYNSSKLSGKKYVNAKEHQRKLIR